jgi:hypothetical protein
MNRPQSPKEINYFSIKAHIQKNDLVPMVARSKACNIFGRSNIGFAASNPARGMDVCPRFFYVVLSCFGRGFASG